MLNQMKISIVGICCHSLHLLSSEHPQSSHLILCPCMVESVLRTHKMERLQMQDQQSWTLDGLETAARNINIIHYQAVACIGTCIHNLLVNFIQPIYVTNKWYINLLLTCECKEVLGSCLMVDFPNEVFNKSKYIIWNVLTPWTQPIFENNCIVLKMLINMKFWSCGINTLVYIKS